MQKIRQNKFAPEILRICDLVKCPICSDVLKTPIELTCTHIFCRNCIRKFSKKGAFYCPICRKVLPRRIPSNNKDLDASINYVKSLCSRIRKPSETDSGERFPPTIVERSKRPKTKRFRTFNLNSVFSKRSKGHLTERSAFVMNWLEDSHKISQSIKSPSVRTLTPRAHNCFCKNAITKPPPLYVPSNHKCAPKQNAFRGHEIQTVNYQIRTCSKALSPIVSKPSPPCKCKYHTSDNNAETTQRWKASKNTQSPIVPMPCRVVTTACKAISVCDKLNYQKERNLNEEELRIDHKCDELIRNYSALSNELSNYLQRQSSNSAKYILINKCLRSVGTKFMIVKDLINDDDEEPPHATVGQSKSIQTFCEKLLDATLQTVNSKSNYSTGQPRQASKSAQCDNHYDKDSRKFETQIEIISCPDSDKSLAEKVLTDLILQLPDHMARGKPESDSESGPQMESSSLKHNTRVSENTSPLRNCEERKRLSEETGSLKHNTRESPVTSPCGDSDKTRRISEARRESELRKTIPTKRLSEGRKTYTQMETSTSDEQTTRTKRCVKSCEDKNAQMSEALNIILSQCAKSTSTGTNEPRWTMATFNIRDVCSRMTSENTKQEDDTTNRATSKSTLHNVDSNILCSSDCPTKPALSYSQPRYVDKSADQSSGLLCGGIAIIIPPPASFQDQKSSKNRATSVSANEKKVPRGKKKAPSEGNVKKGASKIPKGVASKNAPKKGARR